MDGRTLALPMRSSRVSLESDRPLTGVYHVTYHIYDALAAPRLIRLPDGRFSADFSQVYGRLAESFEPAPDFTSWKVHLRQGVRSHAGNELAADDVVWSYQRAFALRAIGRWRASLLAGVPDGGVLALDRYTVEFRIAGSHPTFPRFLCYGTCAIIDSTEAKRHTTENDPWAGDYLKSTPCGFGGWTVAEQNDEVLHLAPRTDSYLGEIPVDGVIYRAAPEREIGLAAFERGDVNLVAGLYPDEARRLAAVPGTRFRYGRTNHATIDFNYNVPPFNNRDAREAVLRLVPYERIIREAYLGLAETQFGIYQPNTPEATSADWPYEHDVERARELVRQAGAEGQEVDLAIVGSEEAKRIGNLVAEALDLGGLKVRVRQVADMGKDEPAHLFLRDDCSHGIADPHYDLAIDFAPPRDMPFRLFGPPRLSARLKEIREAPADQKVALYRQTQRELLADAACVPLAGHSYVIAYREGLAPWFFSEAYLPLTSLHWSTARYILPPYR